MREFSDLLPQNLSLDLKLETSKLRLASRLKFPIIFKSHSFNFFKFGDFYVFLFSLKAPHDVNYNKSECTFRVTPTSRQPTRGDNLSPLPAFFPLEVGICAAFPTEQLVWIWNSCGRTRAGAEPELFCPAELRHCRAINFPAGRIVFECFREKEGWELGERNGQEREGKEKRKTISLTLFSPSILTFFFLPFFFSL